MSVYKNYYKYNYCEDRTMVTSGWRVIFPHRHTSTGLKILKCNSGDAVVNGWYGKINAPSSLLKINLLPKT